MMRGTAFSPEATAVDRDDASMWVALDDGRTIGVPLAWFPRLLNGTDDARRDVFISPSGLHWETLHEDISIPRLLATRMEMPPAASAA